MARSAKSRRIRGRVPVGRDWGGDNGLRVDRIDIADMPAGPNVVVPELGDVLQAIRRAPRVDDWAALRSIVIPVIPRARPFPAGYSAPFTTRLPPGIAVSFAADVGPAFLTIGADQLEALGITQADLVAQALANLIARADSVAPGTIFRHFIADVPVAAMQTGCSIGSTLVLVPDQLRRLFGPDRVVFIAPMRDLLLALPAGVDLDLAAWLFEEFASQDPNCLPPIAYRFDGERIETAALAGAHLLGGAGTPLGADRRAGRRLA